MIKTRVSRTAWRCSRLAFLLGFGLALMPLASRAAPAASQEAICDGSAGQTQLTVSVNGLKEAKGQMAITVYADDRKRFMARGAKLLRQRVPAVSPVTQACFVLPKPGYYAVVVYHDSNADEDFNRSFIGLPAEGYGFSRNPKTLIGLPDLDEVRIPVAMGDNVVAVQLTYP